jgi:hypothetical protein
MIHYLDGKSYEATAQLHGLKKYPWGYSRAFMGRLTKNIDG